MEGKAALMERCDLVVATTGVPGLIKPDMVRPGQVIPALSTPLPEIEPETVPGPVCGARVRVRCP